MADIEIKRGYEVLADNRVRFGIRVINNGDSAISEVEVLLDYRNSLFELEGSKIKEIGTIPPSNPQTVKFILKPLGCVHKEEIGATVFFRDHMWDKHTLDMRPKEIHCVCPFLKEKSITRSDFLKLSAEGYSAEHGVNFENIALEKLIEFLSHTCKNRLYKVDEFSIEKGKVLYLAGESLGEKAYYLLTAVVMEREKIVQVLLHVSSDKSFGIHGFLTEILENLRHLVRSVSSAREIGIIKNEQVINIIDSVVQHTNFSGQTGPSSVNIQDSVVQRTSFGPSEEENRKKEVEEKLRRQQEEARLKKEREEQENLRRQQEEAARNAEEIKRKAREEAERKAQEEADIKAQEEADIKAQEEAARKAQEEAERRQREEAVRKQKEKEALVRKQWEEQKRKQIEEAQRKRREEVARKQKEEAAKVQVSRQTFQSPVQQEVPSKKPYFSSKTKKPKSSSGKRILIFSLIFVFLLIGAAAIFPGSNGDSGNSPEGTSKTSTVQNLSSQTLDTYTNSIGMEFVKIPSGEFKMGSPSGEEDRYDDEGPVHKVTIEDSFYLGKFEVTQEQWREVMGTNPSYFDGDKFPVEQVSWNDAQEFIKNLNEKEETDRYRLPSEAEWEYACRAGTTTRYYFGDDDSKLKDYAWYGENSGSKTHSVGQKKPNPWGLYDMHGNVWEWCQDRYNSDYNGAPSDGSAWESGSSSIRVFRGGGWLIGARSCRSASHAGSVPSYRYGDLGFRVLRKL